MANQSIEDLEAIIIRERARERDARDMLDRLEAAADDARIAWNLCLDKYHDADEQVIVEDAEAAILDAKRKIEDIKANEALVKIRAGGTKFVAVRTVFFDWPLGRIEKGQMFFLDDEETAEKMIREGTISLAQ